MDTFILQIEGAKRWRLHKSAKREEMLAITPSMDFNPLENLPELVWEGVLEAGDLLYMPRGVIHHAATVAGKHSVHITLSN